MVNIVGCEICCRCFLAQSIYALRSERVARPSLPVAIETKPILVRILGNIHDEEITARVQERGSLLMTFP